MSQEINYAAVLADLEARRASLDAAIAAVRALLGQGPAEGVPGTDIARGTPQPQGEVRDASEIKPGTFHGMSVAEAARKFLEMTKTKQRTKDIVAAIQRGGIETTAGSFYSNVYTTLMRRKDFKRLGKNWVLEEWNPNVAAPEVKPAKAKRKAKGKRSAKPETPTAPQGSTDAKAEAKG
jgi:hypothetical protein